VEANPGIFAQINGEVNVKFKLELLINKPPSEVWKFFMDPEKTRTWQPSLISIESIRAERGEPGAVFKWIYKENEREFSLVAEVVHAEEPGRFESRFENEFASNTVNNMFVQKSELQTLWIAETTYNFKTVLMKILGPILKRNYIARAQKEMERFEAAIENE
jgi:uncharacterized protein YndB with AHSA1/START domain